MKTNLPHFINLAPFTNMEIVRLFRRAKIEMRDRNIFQNYELTLEGWDEKKFLYDKYICELISDMDGELPHEDWAVKYKSKISKFIKQCKKFDIEAGEKTIEIRLVAHNRYEKKILLVIDKI